MKKNNKGLMHSGFQCAHENVLDWSLCH